MNATELIPTLRRFVAATLADVRREHGCRLDRNLRLYYVDLAHGWWLRRLEEAAWSGASAAVLPDATWIDLERQYPAQYVRLRSIHRQAVDSVTAET